MKANHLLLGPIAAITVFLVLSISGISYLPAITAAITTLTAWWWATEALPIPATSLIPFAGFPLAGVLSHKQSAAGLGSHVILLLLGGFIMAKALEKCGAHQRFAMLILRTVGNGSYKRLVLAFMLAAAFLSMWVSNTATCLMLMPIALASTAKLEKPELSVPLILSVAYACSIGGIATLIGTPPNVIFAGIYEEVTGKEFGFVRWLKIGLPCVLVMLPIAWLWLTRNLAGACETELPKKQAWSNDQKRVIAVFSVVVLLWIFRAEPFGGWSALTNLTTVGDSTIALLGAALMFIVRSEKGDGLLDWQTAVQVPWGILLMFGAGITIAKAFFESGLAAIIGQALSGIIVGWPILLVLLFICLLVVFLTDLNSNVATTTLIVPILAATASATSLPVELLMIPATIAASCAFMLPVATAPNAIAFATEKVSVKQMMREGLVLNLLMGAIIAVVCYLLLA